MRLLPFLPFLLACHAPAAATPSPEKPAVHGMVLLGSQAIHLSHLPMFHAPHDYQVLLTVRVDTAPPREANALYTIAPKPFRLSEIAPGFSFRADLVRGHFERGGETILADAPIEIERVIHFRKLEAGAPRPAALEYILFGSPGEAFVAHKITTPPDFDHLLAVTVPASISAETLARGVVVSFPGIDPGRPLAAHSTQRALVDGEPVELAVGAEIYLEQGELAR
jgi:hypothetical protein